MASSIIEQKYKNGENPIYVSREELNGYAQSVGTNQKVEAMLFKGATVMVICPCENGSKHICEEYGNLK